MQGNKHLDDSKDISHTEAHQKMDIHKKEYKERLSFNNGGTDSGNPNDKEEIRNMHQDLEEMK